MKVVWSGGILINDYVFHLLAVISLTMEYVVDMQGFKQPVNDYILKELAILPLTYDDIRPMVYLFKEPMPWTKLSDKYKRYNTWLEQYYHGIPWSSGNHEYSTISNILQGCMPNVSVVHVTGSIQKNWLERFKYFKYKVKDEGEMGYPPLDKIKVVTVCENHNGLYRNNCALHNAKLLKHFLIEGKHSICQEYMDCK